MKLRSGDPTVTVLVLLARTMVSARKILGSAFALLGLWGGHVRRPVSHTHLAGPVRNGVVDRRDASHMCSVCQTPMGAPVPQAGGGCSAMKHVHTVTMGQTVSSGATVPMKRCVTASKDASALKDGKGCSVRKKAGQG